MVRIFYPLYVNILIELIQKDAINECESLFYRYYRWFQATHDSDIKSLSNFIKNNKITTNICINNTSNGNARNNGNNNNNNNNSNIREQVVFEDIGKHPIYTRFRTYMYEVEISRVVKKLLVSWLNAQTLTSLIEIINNHIHFTIVSHSPMNSLYHPTMKFIKEKEKQKEKEKYLKQKQKQKQKGKRESNLNCFPSDVIDPQLRIGSEYEADVNEKHINWGISRYLNAIEMRALEKRRLSSLAHIPGFQNKSGNSSAFSGRSSLHYRGKNGPGGDKNGKFHKRVEFSSTHAAQPKLTREQEKAMYKEISHRVFAGPNRLPSICSYRCINSFDRIVCVVVSLDGRFIVVGCNDSVIRLFDVAKVTGQSNDLQRKMNANANTNANASSSNNNSNSNKDKPPIKSGKMEIDDDEAQDNDVSVSTGNNNNNNSNQNIHNKNKKSDFEIMMSSEKEELHCHKLIGHKGPVFNICFNPNDSGFFLSCSSDCTVRLWSTEHYCCLAYYDCHLFPIWNVTYSPLGLYFATVSHDRTCKLFTTERTKPLRMFVGHLTDVNCVKFHPNCNYIATGSSDRTIRLWDIQSGNCIRLMIGHKHNINDLAFTSDGRCLVSASSDKTLRVWDLSTGECVGICIGHEDEVNKVTLTYTVDGAAIGVTKNSSQDDEKDKTNDNNDGKDREVEISSFPLIVSSSLDNTIKFWDMNRSGQQNKCVKTIETGNINIRFLQMTKSNLVMTAGVAQ